MQFSEEQNMIENSGSIPQNEKIDAQQQSENNKKGLFPFMLNRNRYLTVVGIFTLIGVIGGYAYYALVGCQSGSCTITSSPTLSVIWGGVMGYLIPDFFVKQK